MASSNDTRTRSATSPDRNADDSRKPASRSRPGVSADPDSDGSKPGSGSRKRHPAPGNPGDPSPSETDAERRLREIEEKRAAAELAELEFKTISESPLNFEKDSGIEMSPLSRHAVARFKSSERRVQLAEHWQYNDAEIHEYGYF